jgi:hypothetical protein
MSGPPGTRAVYSITTRDMGFESGGAIRVGRRDGVTGESVGEAGPRRLVDMAEKNSWSIEALSALDALLQAEPDDNIDELVAILPDRDGIKERALQILAEQPTFVKKTTEVIAQSSSLEDLATTLKNVPGMTGSDDRFYSGSRLADIVRDVGEKAITHAREKGMEKVAEQDFTKPEFIVAVGYDDLVSERPTIPTSRLGLRAKFLELVNREILQRDLEEIEREFEGLNQ